MSSYGALLARPGARGLAVACGLGWLSFAGYGLAIVLAVQRATASFAVAGATIAAFAVTLSLSAPVRGRLIDRRGPRVLAYLAPVHAAALLALALLCLGHPSPSALFAAAGLAGSSVPPIIATARARWAQVAGPELAGAGHAFNAALGDAAQVVGPALIGVVSTLASPVVAMLVLIPGAAAGALLLARAPGVPRAADGARARGWGVLGDSAGMRTLLVCEVALGVWLGAFEIGTTALATRVGEPGLAALPLGVFAAGSIVASLWSGAARRASSAGRRYLAGTLVMAAVFLVCLAVPSFGPVSGLALLAGAGWGVATVAMFALIDDLVPAAGGVEALTWLTTAQGAGLAAGAAGAGRVAGGTATGAFAVMAAALVAGALYGLARRATLAPVAAQADGPLSPA